MERKQLPAEIPRGGNFLLRILGRLILLVVRFKIKGQMPPVSKMVAIAAPHTSNWDFVVFLGVIFKLGLGVRFLGKHSLFRWPFGFLMRSIGGMPVDRTRSDGVVEQVVSRFLETDKMILCLSPEGTRKKVVRWKTGFHRIAHGAGVPILLVALDYKTRMVDFGPLFHPGDDLDGDMEKLHQYYLPFSEKGKKGK